MNEDFLQFIWKQRLFSDTNQYSTQGDRIQIVDVGRQNFDSGPDFFDARIKIDDVLWAGNIEMHLKSSSWYSHGHDTDPAYDNVILHVVIDEDADVFLMNGRKIPCLSLAFPNEIKKNYNSLMESRKWISCSDEIKHVESFFVRNWMDRMLLERLERKSNDIKVILEQNNNSWEETFYQVLARYFGMRVNAEPFQQLARSIPLKFLAKHKNSHFQLEAMLFGQSGLLEKYDCDDDYLNRLKKEYGFFAQKFQLKPLISSQWKWMRLRPSNFPTVRIAQFASLVYRSEGLFSKFINAENINEISNLLKCQASDYWTTHYQFGIQSSKKTKVLGKSGINALIINCVVPVLFHYARVNSKQSLKDKVCTWLENLPPEKNSISKKWKDCGVSIQSAYHSQALLQLKSDYCDEYKCLHCEFGNRIIRKSKSGKAL